MANFNPDVPTGFTQSVLQRIRQAKRPLLVLGHGVWLSGAKEKALELVNRLAIPVQTTWNAIDLIPDNNPHYFGRANAYGPRFANLIIQNADYILTIGARLGIQHTGYNVKAFARGAFLDMVDLDEGESTKPQLKVDRFTCCDANALITELLQASPADCAADPSSAAEWEQYCNRMKATYPVAPQLEEVRNDTFVDPYYFMEALSDLLPDDALVPLGSSGTSFTVSGQAFRSKWGQRVFHAKGMAAMGFGIPSAIGASIARGRQMAITLVGDGGFQLNSQELQTIAHLQLPVKIFVVNNNGYHAIRVTQENYFQKNYVGSTAETGVSMPNLQALAQAYGIAHRRMGNNTSVRDVIAQTIASLQPEIIEILVDPNKHLLPKLGSFIRADGTMESRPLEDLVPLLERDEFKSNMYTTLWE
jgi:acetolactate synthase-1/2/3 large subunit